MKKFNTKKMIILVVAEALALLIVATSFADTWTQGRGWSRDPKLYELIYWPKNHDIEFE